jgi:hypothetical protein
VAWPEATPNNTAEASNGPWRYFSNTLGHGGFNELMGAR